MGWATETFRLVIVDSPPVLNMADFDLLMGACDSAILVVRSRKTLTPELSRILAEVDPAKLAGVVFNASEERVNGYGYYTSAG
jgi:Mrp family chromosome partitioning ATPase